MTIPETERKIRSALPITRFLTAYLPAGLVNWLIEKSVSNLTVPDGITRQTINANGVTCDWLIPDNSPQDKVLLYLHGGGFIYRASSLHYDMLAHLAQQMGVRALMVDYRIAPEHPFPAPLDDCVTAYRWLLEQGYSAENIVIAGDSAGGNLTLTTAMKLRDDGDPLPAALATLSPVADLSNKSDEFKHVHDDVLHPKAGKFMNQSYIGDDDAKNPLISPLFGKWDGLPPLLIHAGEDELLVEDAERLQSLAQNSGVDVQLKIYPRMWHVWQISLDLPQAKQSLNEIGGFFNAHLNQPDAQSVES